MPRAAGVTLAQAVSDTEVRRLTTALKQRHELTGRRDLRGLPPGTNRSFQDLAPEIQQQVKLINRMSADGPKHGGGDNSNTQFATLALWVGRRHGLPIAEAVARVEARFRGSQNGDGGWGYKSSSSGHGHKDDSTGTMTCAGLLGLAVAHGNALERVQAKDRPGLAGAIDRDRSLQAGLAALGSAIDHPLAGKGLGGKGAGGKGKGKGKGGGPQGFAGKAGGRTYYFLWSLERVAVALGLDTIRAKDWYHWGAEIALASQQADGSWQGEYGRSGVDTCFALLFLRRANLARDLTVQLRGKLKDPGQAVLRARPGGTLRSAVEFPGQEAGMPDRPARVEGPAATREPVRRLPEPAELPRPSLPESTRLARELVQARVEQRPGILERMRDRKGVVYTEALAEAIPRLDNEGKRQAREALASRLTRMKDQSLLNFLKDPEVEIRRAAALACAMKDSKIQIPHLIPLLSDPEPLVVRAAHLALKELSGQTFAPSKEAWQQWWNSRK